MKILFLGSRIIFFPSASKLSAGRASLETEHGLTPRMWCDWTLVVLSSRLHVLIFELTMKINNNQKTLPASSYTRTSFSSSNSSVFQGYHNRNFNVIGLLTLWLRFP